MKWVGRIFLLGIVVVILTGVFMYFNAKAMEAPETQDAPFAIQCYYKEKDGQVIPTRYYYLENVEIVDGDAVFKDFWEYDGARYHKKDGEKIISPPFEIIKRKEG